MKAFSPTIKEMDLALKSILMAIFILAISTRIKNTAREFSSGSVSAKYPAPKVHKC